MSESLESLIQNWSGQTVVSRFDQPSRTWMFICLHDYTLGPCSGGTRMKVYDSPAEGLTDAMRLAEGMTDKWAALELPFGGGKAVLASESVVTGSERTALLGRYGELVESLGGIFQTGEDMGTTSSDLATVALSTQFVHGFDHEGAKMDPSPYTAHGVLAGIRASLEHAFGKPSPKGRTVLIQGVGNVGSHLARELRQQGARLLLTDIDSERAQALAAEVDGETVAPEDLLDAPCDVYAPCAVGAVLNTESIPGLACRIVAGSANNQLGVEADAERLRQRGILYAPDFIVNAGGAFAFALMHQGVTQPETLFQQVEQIGDTVSSILRQSENRSVSALSAAKERVAGVLAHARQAAAS